MRLSIACALAASIVALLDAPPSPQDPAADPSAEEYDAPIEWWRNTSATPIKQASLSDSHLQRTSTKTPNQPDSCQCWSL